MNNSYCRIRSPKRNGRPDYSRGSWFPYYAGFSVGFVEDILDSLALPARAIILDPWLGAGTTSEVAVQRGHRVRGFDINPAMLLIAKARLVSSDGVTSTASIIADGLASFRREADTQSSLPKRLTRDPLEHWLHPSCASNFRRLEQCILAALGERQLAGSMWSAASQASSTTSFAYLALFRTMRRLIRRWQGSNPTWINIPKDARRRSTFSNSSMAQSLEIELKFLLESSKIHQVCFEDIAVLKEGSSTSIPLKDNSVDFSISSPPYCTRIDYVRATLPELSVLGFPDKAALRALQERMIGTPTVSGLLDEESIHWGPTCLDFLKRVRRHTSKASAGYYSKYYLQYFRSIVASLLEINRVLKPEGQCVLVVQTSHYKEILNDLPQIFCEMSDSLGWRVDERINFEVKRTLAGVNPGVRAYRKTELARV